MKFPVISLLARTGHLKAPKETMLLAMESDVQQVHLSGGETLFRKGEIADSLYIVMSGRLRVFARTSDGKEVVAGEIGRGDTVGEMAVLANQPRSATVRAVRDTEVLRVTKTTFDDLITRHPPIILRMMRTVIDRLEQTRQLPYAIGSFVPTTIAVVPMSQRVPIREFVDRLETALSGIGSTLYLNRDHLDKALWKGAAETPRDHSNNSEIVNWLSEREAANRFLIYETDAKWSAWTNRCLRQADCVLLVGMADDSPELCEIEVEMQREWIGQTGVRKELVLLHAGKKDLPKGTNRWLKNRQVRMHHHMSLKSKGDFDRLLRFLTGQAIGLVLGGGGARGCAHIGVIRALQEAGIPIDIIGGTSMGALIGAQLALGWDARQMVEYNNECFNRLKPFNDFTIPFLGLLTGHKFMRIVKQVYGDGQMEDMWIKFFCLSSNLTSAEVMVHEEGPIWRWLCASIAVPGLGPPLFDQGCLLSDGGVLNNLPIDIMRRFIEGIVIASDVSPYTDLNVDPDYNRPPTTVEILWNRINPFAEKMHLPRLSDILFRVTALSGVQAVKAMKHEASLYLHPPTEACGIFDFKLIDQLVEIGYRDAVEKVEKWKKELPAESEKLFKDRITRPS